jgi:hypothetical protein
MAMYMRHSLTRSFSILNRDIETIRLVEPFQRMLYPRHGQEEVADLIFGQV